jgi:hypothetical protein
MAFDLKKDWSTSDISLLLASVEDDRSWRLEVTTDGIAQLHDLTTPPAADYEQGLHCYFEIWDEGTDFVGVSAAADKDLCRKIERILRDNYPVLKGPPTLSAL